MWDSCDGWVGCEVGVDDATGEVALLDAQVAQAGAEGVHLGLDDGLLGAVGQALGQEAIFFGGWCGMGGHCGVSLMASTRSSPVLAISWSSRMVASRTTAEELDPIACATLRILRFVSRSKRTGVGVVFWRKICDMKANVAQNATPARKK